MKILFLIYFFIIPFAYAERFIVEAHHQLSVSDIKRHPSFKIQPFSFVQHHYFSRLYIVSAQSSQEILEKLPWAKHVENSVELTQLSLLPSDRPERLVHDELFPYQWSLLNQGQSYIREKDDIHNLPLAGVSSKDVGWKNIYLNLPQIQRMIVAVLDSGVDLEHPDIKENLWKNDKECGQDPNVDHDNNKLPGDCHGWNFTEAIDSEEAKSPQDFDGHGSHVAGIIAAAQNDIGIVGINPRALIMPVKVMRDANSKSEVATSESFAQGIIYATNMGANIINLSLGWPKSLETKYLREAIYYALSKNVIIVAAAGNNNSSEPLFPCAYDGVICTAASTLDGRFAGFSNFGGHIDTVTPGEAILSLNPMQFEPEFFSVPGYDIKSGTSQASPVLAGLISILKAQEPTISLDEIFGRLYSARQNDDKDKYVLGGNATWDSLSRKITGPVIRPVLKRIRQIILNGSLPETKLNVPIRNLGLEASKIVVQIESLSTGVEFIDGVKQLDLIKSSEIKDLLFDVRVTNLYAESQVKIKITISGPEGILSFLNDIPVVRDIKNEALFKKNSFTFAKKPLPMGSIVNGRINPFLSTLESYGASRSHEFYVRRTSKEEKSLTLTVFRHQEDNIIEAIRPIVINQFQNLINFLKVDLNLDGQEDYLVQTINEDQKGKYFQFAFYNHDFLPLWNEFQDVRVELDLNVARMDDLRFIRLDHNSLGKMMIPSFFTEGQLPKIDQRIDFYGRWDTSKENRLYYLEPQISERKFRIRALTTNIWKEKVKADLKSKWFESVISENILPVSSEDASKGLVRIIMSVGQGTLRKIFISTFDSHHTLLGNPIPQLVLQSENIDPLLSITENGFENNGEVFFNVYDRTRIKVVTTKNSQQIGQVSYNHKAETDFITGHIASFKNAEETTTVLQTRDELVTISSNEGQTSISMRPKLRYSFFSSKVLSEMYHPVSYNRDNTKAPALYVDSTAVTGNRIYLFETQAGSLVSSILNSIIVPSNCKALNPSYSFEAKTHEFVFLCLEEKDWFIRTYEMK
jgi:cell wall-associated protease